jgi:hypothetical protein
MSWQNKLENIQFTIKTGDGKEWFPLWKSGEKSKEFNTSIYDFIDVPKSLVERKQPKSSKYPLTFWFDGENHVDTAEEFERSAEDKRYWTITHPYYGTIKGQPLSISRNDNNLNITEISVDFWESIVFDYPKSNLSIQDNTLVKKNDILNSSATSYSGRKVQEVADIQKIKESNLQIAKSFDNLQTNETFSDYQNALSQAQKASDNLLNDSFDAIFKSEQLLNLPSTYEKKVIDKINGYISAYNGIKRVLNSVSDKLFFESIGASVLSCYCNASVNYQFGVDYTVATEVEQVASNLIQVYEDYLQTLDNASTSNYEIETNYQPNATVQTQLNDLVLFTLANLYNLAFESQQERIVYTTKETNIVLLTHRYLGLASDENIETFRQINNIKLKELFRIKKERKIKYYV